MKFKEIALVTGGAFIITISEFLRNEVILKDRWIEQFDLHGLVFETALINGILWFAWSVLLSYVIYELSKVFTFMQTLILVWLAGFLMMWIVAFNLQVLPLSLLLFAVPWSILEIAVVLKVFAKLR